MMSKQSGVRVNKFFGVSTLVAALVGTGAMIQSGDSQAQSAPYGCACLHNNKVSVPINYRFRWGDRDWKKVSLAPGKVEWMCWTYKDAPKSPELQFQLDVDMTANANWQTFSIARAQSKEQSCSAVPASAHYHVGYVAGSNKKKIQIFGGKS